MSARRDNAVELKLRVRSKDEWITAVTSDFDAFLCDHAANERKASAMAMSMVAHYPDRTALVTEMVDLALEELNHFRQVVKIIVARGILLRPDEKDPYVNSLVARVRKPSQEYFLDRLLVAAVIEARGAERFEIVANHVEEPELKIFYQTLAKSEKNHHELFISLALLYFKDEEVVLRLADLLSLEEEVIDRLPIRPRLH